MRSFHNNKKVDFIRSADRVVIVSIRPLSVSLLPSTRRPRQIRVVSASLQPNQPLLPHRGKSLLGATCHGSHGWREQAESDRKSLRFLKLQGHEESRKWLLWCSKQSLVMVSATVKICNFTNQSVVCQIWQCCTRIEAISCSVCDGHLQYMTLSITTEEKYDL